MNNPHSLQFISSLLTRAEWQVFEQMLALHHLFPNGLHCSIAFLQKKTGRSKSTILRCQKKLERHCLFHIERRKHFGRFGQISQKTNVYTPFKWLVKLFSSTYAHLLTGVSKMKHKTKAIKEIFLAKAGSSFFSKSQRDKEKRQARNPRIYQRPEPSLEEIEGLSGSGKELADMIMGLQAKIGEK